MEESKNRLNRQRQELEREVNSLIEQLQELGQSPRPGAEFPLFIEAIKNALIEAGVLSKEQIDIAYLKILKGALSNTLAQVQAPVSNVSKLVIPGAKGLRSV